MNNNNKKLVSATRAMIDEMSIKIYKLSVSERCGDYLAAYTIILSGMIV